MSDTAHELESVKAQNVNLNNSLDIVTHYNAALNIECDAQIDISIKLNDSGSIFSEIRLLRDVFVGPVKTVTNLEQQLKISK